MTFYKGPGRFQIHEVGAKLIEKFLKISNQNPQERGQNLTKRIERVDWLLFQGLVLRLR